MSATAARAIVVLAKYDIAPDESDARAVRCVLALRAGLPWLSGHTVVEMRDVDNLPILELLAGGSKEQATHSIQAIVPHDVIGRLMIQCARQRHLAEVYDHLCGFDGCEFYFQNWPDLTARRWGEVLYSFADACPIGVRHGAADGSAILLNPPDDYRMRAGDELLVVAEDDDTYSPDLSGAAKAPKVGAAPAFEARKATNDNVLLCGWRRDLLDMLMELDKYVQPGCVVTILASVPLSQRTALLETGKATRLELQNIQLTHEYGSTILRRDLEKVRSLPLLPLSLSPFLPVPCLPWPFYLPSCRRRRTADPPHCCRLFPAAAARARAPQVMSARAFGSVLVLASESNEGDEAASDSRALATLLLVRDIRSKIVAREKAAIAAAAGGGGSSSSSGGDDDDDGEEGKEAAAADFTLLGEILDSETKDLVAAAGVSDYIMSNRLISKVIAMVAEDVAVGPLFELLFSEEGDELYVRDCRYYAAPGEKLAFWEMQARARAQGDVAIGYKRKHGGVALNPANKGEKLLWEVGSSLIIIGDH